jgi:uncharacterized protein YgiM (DUF1202 family)
VPFLRCYDDPNFNAKAGGQHMIFRLISLVVLLMVVAMPLSAQTNMLGNSGFDSEVYRGYSVNYSLPDYWGGGYREKAASDASWQHLEPFGLPHTAGFRTAGERSFHMSRGSATFEAWIFQQVNVAPGTTLTGGAKAYIESGPDAYAWVGIDPFGGTNPSSGTIVWNGLSNSSNRWLDLSVNVTARAGTVTLFLFAEQSSPYDPNGVYWDEAYLIATGGSPQPAQPAPAAPAPVQQQQNFPPGAQLLNANTRVNVRAGASTTFDIIGVIRPGEIYTVIDITGNWAQIDYLGRAGYVARNLATITGSQPIESEAAISSDVTYTARNRVNLRAGAGTGFGRIDTLPIGATVKAVRRSPDNVWLEVEYNGQRGWVAARYGSITGNMFGLPT